MNSTLDTLVIRNFQSIREMEINFISGINALNGPNEIGKSAIVKSMEMLFKNIPSIWVKHYRRKGTKSMYVEGRFSDGVVIAISRGNENYYRIKRADGSEEVFKVVSEVPAEIENYFNLYYEEGLNKKKNDIELLNIRHPRDSLIGVTTSPAENFNLFQKAIKTEDMYNNLKKAESDFKAMTDRARDLQSDLASDEEALRGLPEVALDGDLIMSTLDSQKEILDQLDRAKEIMDELESYNGESAVLTVDSEDIDKSMDELELLLKAYRMLTDLEVQQVKLKLLEDTAEFMDNLKFEYELNMSLMATFNLQTELEVMSTQLNPFDLPADFTSESLGEIELLVQAFRTQLKADSAISEMNSAEDLVNLLDSLKTSSDDLRFMLNSYNSLSSIRESAIEFQKAHQEYAAASEESMRYMKEHRFCPVIVQNNFCPFGVDPAKEGA